MNLGDIRNRCRSRFRDVFGAIYDDTEWNLYINEALTDVVNASPMWPFLETTSAVVTRGAAHDRLTLGLDIPSAMRVIDVWNLTEGIQLVETADSRQADANHPLSPPATVPERGITTSYHRLGNALLLLPPPAADTDFRVDYVSGLMTDLVADEDTPSALPDRYHRMLIDGAMARAYQDDGNMDQHNAAKAAFDSQLANLMTELIGGRNEDYPALIDNFWG